MARREVTGRKPGVSADLIERSDGPPDTDDEEDEEDEPTQRRDPKKSKRAAKPSARGPPNKAKGKPRKKKPKRALPSAPPVEALAFTIPEFCFTHRICIETFYRQARKGLMPPTMQVGGKTLISAEAAKAWRREREAATAERRRERGKAAAALSDSAVSSV
jgi:hypothetical protein